MGCGVTTLRSELLDPGSIDGQLQTTTGPEAKDIVNDMQDIHDMDTISFLCCLFMLRPPLPLV